MWEYLDGNGGNVDFGQKGISDTGKTGCIRVSGWLIIEVARKDAATGRAQSVISGRG